MSYDKKNKLHIVAVTAVIRNIEGRYLVVKRSSKEISFPNMWSFPGGKVEGNESIEEALSKEVMEEVGLNIMPAKVLLKDASFIRPDGQSVKVFAFLCEAVDPVEVKLDVRDFSEYRWISLDDVSVLEHVGIEEEIRKADEFISMKLDLNTLGTRSEKIEI